MNKVPSIKEAADIVLHADWASTEHRIRLSSAKMASSAAAGLLGRQLKQLQTDKDIPGISCGLIDNNVFLWEVMVMISDDCNYYGGASFSNSGL